MSSGAGASPIASKVSQLSSVIKSTKSSSGKLISDVFGASCACLSPLQKLVQLLGLLSRKFIKLDTNSSAILSGM